MQAFLGSEQVKETYLSRVKAHRAADELIHGVYWENGKGCKAQSEKLLELLGAAKG